MADISNPVFFDVVRGAERAVAGQDYTLLLAESEESAESAESAANELRAAERLTRSVDGPVLTTSRLADEQILELADLMPVVLINRRPARAAARRIADRAGTAVIAYNDLLAIGLMQEFGTPATGSARC